MPDVCAQRGFGIPSASINLAMGREEGDEGEEAGSLPLDSPAPAIPPVSCTDCGCVRTARARVHGHCLLHVCIRVRLYLDFETRIRHK